MTRAALWFAASLLWSLPGAALADQLPDHPHLYVHGVGEVEFAPQRATFFLDYSGSGPTIDDARQALEPKVAALLRAAAENGIDDSDITAAAASIRPDSEYLDGERVVTGVTASRQVHVTLRNLDRFDALAQAGYGTDPAAMNVRLSGRDDAALAEAQRAAVADARQRAARLADSLGMTISGVHSLSEFDLREKELYRLRPSLELSNNAQDSTRFAAAFGRPASPELFLPGSITATATVYVVYLIEARR